MKDRIAIAWISAVWLWLSCVGHAASAREETVLLTGATVHTITGTTLESGQVFLKEGRIDSIGPALNVEADRVVNLNGYHLYPGLIAPVTTLGLVEIEGVRATRDFAEVGDFVPELRSWVAVNPDSELLAVARANGITHAGVAPQGGILAGYSGLIALDGWTPEQMLVKGPNALHLYWPDLSIDTTPKQELSDPSKWKSPQDQSVSRRQKVHAIHDFFQEAQAYLRGRETADAASAAKPEIVPGWEAMRPCLKGDVPLMIHADEYRQIKQAVEWVIKQDLRAVIVGGRDAWRLAGVLATNRIPVVFGAVYNLPASQAVAYDSQFRAPAILQQAGVKLAFGLGIQFETANLRNLPYAAAQAVAHGLPPDEALKALTLYPAQICGLAERLGSLEPGKEASLFASDGDILDIRSNVRRLWIAGREVSLESRHTRLFEKYRARPRSEPVSK